MPSAAFAETIVQQAQEALTNMFRHSGARNGWVALKHKDKELMITVRDDGKGIVDSVSQFMPDAIGMGIGGMRQRVKEFGGDLRLENINPGTLVEVIIPTKALTQRAQEQVPLAWMSK